MHSRTLHNSKLLRIATFCLVTLGLVLSPATTLSAQALEEAVGPPRVTTKPAIDDAAFLWQNETTPFVRKPGSFVAGADNVKETEQFAYALYLPATHTEEQAETAAAWKISYLQTFEGAFPAAGWEIVDYNGTTVGGYQYWGKRVGGYSSTWAVHPNDSSSYVNNTDTWMTYGPFNLVGTLDARYSFVYWLHSEADYDFFSWEFDCNGRNNFQGQSMSGPVGAWIAVTVPLTACIGRSYVYIKFTFKSDYQATGQGVWVDDFKIEKYK